MNTQYFLFFLVVISGILFLIQRTDPSARRIVIFVMIFPAILLRNFATYRHIEVNTVQAFQLRNFTAYQNIDTEALTALWVAILLNIAYWLFIGRHTASKPPQEIRVLKLDD